MRIAFVARALAGTTLLASAVLAANPSPAPQPTPTQPPPSTAVAPPAPAPVPPEPPAPAPVPFEPPEQQAAPLPTSPGVPPPQASAPTPPATPAPETAPAPAGPPPTIVFHTPPPPVAAPDPTARRHDGFYLRLGLGVGFLRSVVDFEEVGSTSEVKARGNGAGFEFALGGTVAPGLVIGGGIYTVSTGTVTWEFDSESAIERYGDNTVEGGEGAVSVLGVMLDFYPNPRGGFHIQGGLGLGAIALENDDDTDFPGEKWEGGGGGLMLGAGYEFWISDQWSLGGVGRVLMVSGKVRGSDSDRDYDAKAIAPALLFVATHH